MSATENVLQDAVRFLDKMDAENAMKLFDLIGVKGVTRELLTEWKLWGDYLPVGIDNPYTAEERNLHIAWECIDRVPLGIDCAFSIPFRAEIAKRLFRSCGDGFVANEGCRFNYGNRIDVGKNVSWNHACYVDAKGGVRFGDCSIMTEYTRIFTHGHSESDHEERSYAPVEIGEYAKLYTACTILPGVKVGRGAIVATCSVVTKDVDDFTLVAGIPAKPLRKRKSPEDVLSLNHYMFAPGVFQPPIE